MSTVTAIVPNYNHRLFLDQRIQSVLAQTYPHLEVLLLDDASTDGSLELLESYRKKPRVTGILANKVNTGTPFKQWNKGIAESRSEYVWIAESDDYADPTLVAKLVDVLEKNPAVGVAYSQSLGVDERSNVMHSLVGWTRDLHPTRWDSSYINSGVEECRNYFVRKCTIPNASGVVFRRALYESVGGADESFKLAGDWLLWAKLLLAADVAFVAEPLNYFRIHANTVRKRTARGAIGLLEAIKVFDYIRNQIDLSEEVYEDVCERLLARWVEQLALGRYGLSVNVDIYNRISQVDKRLAPRLLGRFARKIRGVVQPSNRQGRKGD